jgi:hypothetical protein
MYRLKFRERSLQRQARLSRVILRTQNAYRVRDRTDEAMFTPSPGGKKPEAKGGVHRLAGPEEKATRGFR